jgi:imidazolonepropionase-like amidohydrolase
VDFLKYGASGHWNEVVSFITFSPRTQRAIIEEGHRAGMVVQAHTTTTESLDLAIESGLDLITHGDISVPDTPIPPETLKKLVDRGIAVSVLPATRRHLEARARLVPAWQPLPYWRTAQTNRRNMIKAGVTLLVSTDGGVENPALVAESPTVAADTVDSQWKLGEGHFNALVALEEEGMAPMEILKSVTSNIARAYHRNDVGTLEPGKLADLVILDADPLESARNYRRIYRVLKDGKVVDRDALPVHPVISEYTTRGSR